LSRQALDAALEIANLEVDVDGLLEANSRIAVENTGRTGHDRCYTANRHELCLLWAQARGNADLVRTGRQARKSPGTGSESPDTRALLNSIGTNRCPSRPELWTRHGGRFAAGGARGIQPAPGEKERPGLCKENPRWPGQAGLRCFSDGGLPTTRPKKTDGSTARQPCRC